MSWSVTDHSAFTGRIHSKMESLQSPISEFDDECDQNGVWNEFLPDNHPDDRNFLSNSDIVDQLRKITNPEDPLDKYSNIEFIGEGAWGEVYKAIEKSTGRQVAIKMMTLSQLDEEVIEEILIMKANHHRNVVTYIDSFLLVDKDLLWIVMEYLSGGSLSDSLHITVNDEQVTAAICLSVCSAIDYIHQNHIVHRDVKSANVLLGLDGSVKLADFGLSTRTSPLYRKLVGVCGTAHFMAPELATGKQYDSKVDVWAMGIMAIEMITNGKLPYWDEDDDMALYNISINGKPDLTNENWSTSFRDFLSCCLEADPKKRASASELLKHSFLQISLPVAEIEQSIETEEVEVAIYDSDKDQPKGFNSNLNEDGTLDVEDKMIVKSPEVLNEVGNVDNIIENCGHVPTEVNGEKPRLTDILGDNLLELPKKSKFRWKNLKWKNFKKKLTFLFSTFSLHE